MKKFTLYLIITILTVTTVLFAGCGGHSHTYTTETIAPTCTEVGYDLHRCSCGYTYRSNQVPALGHNYVDGICSVCGEEGEAPQTYTIKFDLSCTVAGDAVTVKVGGFSTLPDETVEAGETLSFLEDSRVSVYFPDPTINVWFGRWIFVNENNEKITVTKHSIAGEALFGSLTTITIKVICYSNYTGFY